jgi:ParB/RepB/Spo0J family partition protein
MLHATEQACINRPKSTSKKKGSTMKSKATKKPAPHSATAASVAIEDLAVWDGNTRQADPDTLEDLAASIRELGILEPLITQVRDGILVVVAGARRLAAARLAGLTAVPCVQIPPDANAAAVCAAENLAREDIRPLEASEQVLAMQAAGMSIEAVALAVGKPIYWVRRAAQLAKLSNEAWAQVHKNPRLSLLFLARLAAMPPALQDYVCDRLTEVFEGEGDHAALKNHGERYSRAIAMTPWLAKDPDCPDCPKRTDAQPDLFGDDPREPSCLDPFCCERKRCEFVEARLFAAKATIPLSMVMRSPAASASYSKARKRKLKPCKTPKPQ